MKLYRLIALACAIVTPVMAAEQSSYVFPTSAPPVGGRDFGSIINNYINPGMRAIASCHLGPTAPANGPSNSPLQGQCWEDTSASPILINRVWDGASWIARWSVDTSSHAFTVTTSSPLRTVTGTNDTFQDSDRGKLLDVCNAAGVTHTLPQAGTSGAFSSGWNVQVRVPATCAGIDTITPVTSTIDGSATIAVRQGQSLTIISDGTNYKTSFLHQPANDNLWSISGLAGAAGKVPFFTAPFTTSLFDSTSFGRSVLNVADASALRTLAGSVIGSNVQAFNANLAAIAGTSTSANKLGFWSGTNTYSLTDFSAFARTLLDDPDAATARSTLGVVIGTNVQAWDPDLDAFALKTAPTGAVVGTTDTQTLTNKTLISPSISTPTGIVKSDVGLGNVDDTSDATKNAATATLTNKTFDTDGAGNNLSIAGVAVTSNTGTGPVVRSNDPTIARLVTTGLEDHQGAIKFTGVNTPAQITASQNDYNPSSVNCTVETLRLSSDASRDVTGLGSPISGCEMTIINVGSNGIIFKDQSGASTATNRFAIGSDIILGPSNTVKVRYDNNSLRWRVIGTPGSSGGGGATSVSCEGFGVECSTIATTVTIKGNFPHPFMLSGM